MNIILDYKKVFLCVLRKFEISDGPRGAVMVREWHPVHVAEETEVRTLLGLPVTLVNSYRNLRRRRGRRVSTCRERKEQTGHRREKRRSARAESANGLDAHIDDGEQEKIRVSRRRCSRS
jgi:hypothetical protein